MLRNYMLIAFRNLIRQKGFSAINILGLGVGMASSILIFLWVSYELSYDRFNQNRDNLFVVVQTQHYVSGPLTTTSMPGPIARDLKTDFPEISKSMMYYSIAGIVSREDKFFSENVRFADPPVFSMLTFNFLEGNPSDAFKDLHSAVITEKLAKKYFGDEEAIGKVLKINAQHEYKVTGVISDIPENSSFRFDICIPYENIKDYGFQIEKYGWNTYGAMVELAPGVNYKDFNVKINDFLEKKSNPPDAKPDDPANSDIDLFLFPLTKLHLYSVTGNGGDIQYIYIFSAIALFILIIACINFMNLSTARAMRRSREVGIRKMAGAIRQQLIFQFIGESLLITIIAFITAIILVYLFLPSFNVLADKSLEPDWTSLSFIGGLAGIILFTAVLAGSYPAFYLSSFRPIEALRNFPGKGRGGFRFRRALVVFQFTLSVILIISTIVVYRQLQYIHTKKLGMNKENVVYTFMRGKSSDNYNTLRSELLQDPNILDVTRSSHLPFQIGSNSGGISWDGKSDEDDVLIGFTFADMDYVKTLGMKMAQGRYFDPSYGTDTSAVVINQDAAKVMGMDDPIGKWLNWGGTRFTIIGVVDDFHFLPLNYEISPLIIVNAPKYCNLLMAKLNSSNIEQTLNQMQTTWEKINPGFPFEYKFLDNSYDQLYQSEQRLGSIFKYFSILTIFISCLGLFGLAAFMSEQRTKEIGVRKVLGAGVDKIFYTLSEDFLKWILLSNLIAIPLAYYIMYQWLKNYVYHTDLSPLIFLLALVISVFIAILTVSYQTIKAASRNPVDALKFE